MMTSVSTCAVLLCLLLATTKAVRDEAKTVSGQNRKHPGVNVTPADSDSSVDGTFEDELHSMTSASDGTGDVIRRTDMTSSSRSGRRRPIVKTIPGRLPAGAGRYSSKQSATQPEVNPSFAAGARPQSVSKNGRQRTATAARPIDTSRSLFGPGATSSSSRQRQRGRKLNGKARLLGGGVVSTDHNRSMDVSRSNGRRLRPVNTVTVTSPSSSSLQQADSTAVSVSGGRRLIHSSAPASASPSRERPEVENHEEKTNEITSNVAENQLDKQTGGGGAGGGDVTVGPGHADKQGGRGVSGSVRGVDAARSCDKMKCQRGGQCVVDKDVDVGWARCLCPLGSRGVHCEQDVIIRHPMFRGAGFLALPALRGADRQLVVDVEFRPDGLTSPIAGVTSRPGGSGDNDTSTMTSSTSGGQLLLFSSDRDDAQFDFFSVTLLPSGQVEFRFDCGTGMGMARSKNRVILGEWNTVRVQRHDWNGYIQLNNGPETGTQSKGLFSRMTLRRELFVGGVVDVSLPANRTGATSGFIGCVRLLKINNKTYDMRKGTFVGDSLYGIDVDECSSGSCTNITCQNGGSCVAHGADSSMCLCPLWTAGNTCDSRIDIHVPSFGGHSYLQYIGLRRTLLMFASIEIVFRTASPDGLLLYNGYATDGTGDFISLAVRNGSLEYRYDLGTGPAIIRSSEPITLNDWHVARLTRNGRHGSLQVDRQLPVNGSSSGAFTQLTLTLDLFVGGHRNFDEVARNAEVDKSFTGCIQKLVINERVVKLVTDALTGVNVADCSQHPCSDRPCQNGGLCIPLGSSYRCRCPVGFDSINCEIRTARYRYRYRYRRQASSQLDVATNPFDDDVIILGQ